MTNASDLVAQQDGMRRRLLGRAVAAASLMLAVCLAAMWVAAMLTFREEIVPEFRHQAQGVGADLVIQISRAQELGIPLGRLVGAQELFDTFLDNHARLDYVALRDTTGKTLFVSRRGAQQPGGSPAAIGVDPDRDVAIQIDVEGRRIGSLHVGVASLRTREFAQESLWYSVMLLLAGTVAAGCLLRGFIERAVAAPLALLQRLLTDFAAGNWGVRAERTGAPELRRVLGAINGALRQVAEHWRRVAWLAAEVGHSEARAQLAQAQLARVPGRVPAQEYVLPAPPGTLARTLLLFAGGSADQLIAWHAPQETGAALVLAELATLLLLTGFGPRLAAGIPHGVLFVAGCVTGAVGEAISSGAVTPQALVLGRAIAGLGVGLLVLACVLSSRVSREAGGRAPGTRELAAAVAAGIAGGAASGSLLVNYTGSEVTGYVAAALLLLLAPLGLRLTTRSVRARQRQLDAPMLALGAALGAAGVIGLAADRLLPDDIATPADLVALYGFVLLGSLAVTRTRAAQRRTVR
ncbi:MAG: hypothetical protein WDN25_15165 [Acetobacteraceae bacterium]